MEKEKNSLIYTSTLPRLHFSLFLGKEGDDILKINTTLIKYSMAEQRVVDGLA